MEPSLFFPPFGHSFEPPPSCPCFACFLQGIGPAYSSKIVRNGVRIGDLQFFDDFKERFRALVQYAERTHGNSLNVDVEKEIAYYESVRDLVRDFGVFFLKAPFVFFGMLGVC